MRRLSYVIRCNRTKLLFLAGIFIFLVLSMQVFTSFKLTFSTKKTTKEYLNVAKSSLAKVKDSILPRGQLPDKYKNQNFKGWPDKTYYWSGIEPDPKEDVAFASYYTQSEIWKHQHPDSCSGKKFAVLEGPNSGLGSEWHQLGAMLAVALDWNRIAVWAIFKKSTWFSGIHCGEPPHSFACFFERLTNCTLTEDEVRHAGKGKRFWRNTNSATLAAQKVVLINPWVARKIGFSLVSHTPAQFSEILSHYHEDPKFWWRSQASTYMLRPNLRTLERMDMILHDHKPSLNHLPRGCISIHVRHGDKGHEMTLFNLASYITAAENMLSSNATLVRLTGDLNETRKVRAIYLSTEDPEVIEETANFWKWRFFWLHEELTNANMGELQSQGAERVIKDLVTLKLHLQCSAAVATWGSNWNRLIEELRSTLGFRPHAPVWDLNNKCLYRENQGCTDNPKNFDYDW